MFSEDIKIGGLYYAFYPSYEEAAPTTICNILSFPRTPQNIIDDVKPEIIGRLVQKEPFIILEVGPVINPYFIFHGEYSPLWIKILYREIIGWIRIDSDRICEIK